MIPVGRRIALGGRKQKGKKAGADQGFPKARLPMQLSGGVLGHILRSVPATAGQIHRMSLKLVPANYAMSTGSLAMNYALSASGAIESWSSWAAVFNEYCIVGARLFFNLVSTGNYGGFVAVYIDEKSGSSPGAGDLDKPYLRVIADASPSPDDYCIEWKTADYLDLQWTSTGTSITPVWFKGYASTASTFTSGSNSSSIMFAGGEVAVDFRGLK